ncbi:MAG: O-antigen ligase family protein [Vicinamibacterales bacterium]
MELHLPALGLTALLTVILTAWRPVWALTALVASLPFFTRHPSAAASTGFMVVVAVFEATWLLRRRPSPRAALAAIGGTPLLACAVAFAVAAVASLPALPLEGIWAETLAGFRTAHPRDWPWLVELLFRHVEFRREFSITSTLLTLQAVGLMLIVYRETLGASPVARRLALTLASSVLVSVLLGALELGRVIDLTPLRGTVAVFVREGTMQSVAGNPGWFTEFVAYALPYGLVLLAGGTVAGRAGLALAGYTGVLFVALLLGFQRGGWITGVALCAYVAWMARGLDRGTVAAADARRTTRAAVAGLAAIALAGVLVLWWRTPVEGIDFGERLRTITSGDRLPYWQAAARIWSRHPILGGGHESFAYRYHRYFDAGGVFHDDGVRVPDAASAHSLYMQTLSGTGAVGLLVLLALLGVAALTGARARRAPGLDEDARAVAVAAAGSLLGVALYGFAQEVFYIHALRLLTFLGVGLLAATAGRLVTWPAGASRAVFTALAAAAVAHAGYERAWASPERLLAANVESGLYEQESNAGHEPIRWTTEEAAVPIPAGVSHVEVDVRSAAPLPQQVRMMACGHEARVDLTTSDWQRLSLDLNSCAPGAHVRLRALPAWRPAGDARLLGVMTREARFR